MSSSDRKEADSGDAATTSGSTPMGGSGIQNPGLIGIPPPDAAFDISSLHDLGLEADVMSWITSHVPSRVELFPSLAPFMAEYLPAAGEVDEFIKPPRPDGREDGMGLKRVDEAGVAQSDPTVLDLQLRAVSKKSGLEPVSLKSLEHAEKNPKDILKWVASIAELRRSAPPPSVRYSRPMPDIEALMQEWPAEFEQQLRQIPLPTADMQMTTEEYARVVCTVLDIPIHTGGAATAPGNLIQALHLLFSLWSEFKSNAHFGGRA